MNHLFNFVAAVVAISNETTQKLVTEIVARREVLVASCAGFRKELDAAIAQSGLQEKVMETVTVLTKLDTTFEGLVGDCQEALGLAKPVKKNRKSEKGEKPVAEA